MGKQGKKQRHPQRSTRRQCLPEDDANQDLPSSAYNLPDSIHTQQEEEDEQEQEQELELELEQEDGPISPEAPSKFTLYQKSVQSPKGDISYLQKFFLMYIGGRLPLHLQEDFCGTALLSTEWLKSDPRRNAVGLDLDLEALMWCLENNVDKVGPDGYSRISLYHGNVLQPLQASAVRFKLQDTIKDINLNKDECLENSCEFAGSVPSELVSPNNPSISEGSKKIGSLPARDIVCAFNYSCCCLHTRKDLVIYFKHVLECLSKKGGIFVMDLYGGASSERQHKIKRRFANFTYVWEQEEFDIINRTTRISLHFILAKKQTLRHAFSYNWRIWSLPEVNDCLLEAGFRDVHFWIQPMTDIENSRDSGEFHAVRGVKYEEVSSFQQQDAWNAYVVAVAK